MAVSVAFSSLNCPVSQVTAPDQTNWEAVAGCKKICTRQLDSNTVVNIFRYKDDFIIESIMGNDSKNKRCHQETVDLEDLHMSPEEFEELAKNKFLIVNEDDTVDFTSHPWSRKSELDPNATIDGDHWGVTLAVAGRSKVCDAKSWAGHAVVIIETVESGGYNMQIADALGGDYGLLKARIFPHCTLEDLKKSGFCGTKTPTWVKTKEMVQRMIGKIEEETKQSKNNPMLPVGFTPDGKPFMFDVFGGHPSRGTYNCLEWAKEKLRLADIILPDSWVPSDSAPNLAIGSKEISAWEKVALTGAVNIAGAGHAVDGYVADHTIPDEERARLNPDWQEHSKLTAKVMWATAVAAVLLPEPCTKTVCAMGAVAGCITESRALWKKSGKRCTIS